ncbi:MAG: ABC transporter substrate-binding protein [Clostridia bacterium]|nr:ABC transporter substrate-binding protein [Clostridia bacterium]
MKKWISLFAAVFLCLSLAACTAQPDVSDPVSEPASSEQPARLRPYVRVYALAGPTGIGMASLMEQSKKDTTDIIYNFTIATKPDEVVSKVLSGEVDFAAVPTNLAATLYNKTEGDIRVIAINTLGVLYMLQDGADDIKTVADLKGKTIYSTGQGANPEYVLRYLLTKNGLDPDKDVEIVFVAENEELAALVLNGTASVALVPEPLATTLRTKKATVNTVLNLSDEWNKVTDDGSRLTMGCVITRKAIAEQNADVVELFLTEYKASMNAAIANPTAVGALCQEYGILPNAELAAKAIPKCSMLFVKGTEMKTMLSGYLKVLYDANPKAVGGKLPDDAFYFGA